MDSNAATLIAMISLFIAVFSPFLAYWRIRIERIKLEKKDSSKRQGMITDALRLYASMSSRSQAMLHAIIERRHLVIQQRNSDDDITAHINLLSRLEKKLYKRIKKINHLYEKTAALRIGGDWDEDWLRTEIDSLMIGCQSTLIYDDPEKEIASFCQAGIYSMMYDTQNNFAPVSNTLWDSGRVQTR